MTTTLGRPTGPAALPAGQAATLQGGSQVARKGNLVVEYLTTTDHKKIGYMYLTTSFIYFLLGGVLALVIRAQLAAPWFNDVATPEIYNQLFTMHGTIMLLM